MGKARGRILLVEDTESSRYILGSWLRRAGYRVLEAATGAEGLKLAGVGGADSPSEAGTETEIDVVVLDVHLPDMSGLDVCRILKAAPTTAAVPVLHVSATAVAVSDRTTGLTSGADGYLVEPVEPEELVATVAALQRYSAARRKAERLARQLGALTTTTLQVNGADTLDDLLMAAASGAADVFASDVTIVAAIDGGQAGYARAAPALASASISGSASAEVVSPGVVTAIANAVATAIRPGTAGAEAAAVVSRDILGPGALPPRLLPGEPDASLLVTLLETRSRSVVGAVLVATGSAGEGSEPELDDGDALLVRQLGQSVGGALENLRLFHEEHHIALTLQRSLLPERLPFVPGLAFAARYNASSKHASVGGDFFDAFVLPDGSVLVAIGDVQGHSLQAATTMAELRYSLRAYAMEGHGPSAILQRLNDLLLTGHPEETATACLLRFAPDLASLTFANAGHLPPLLISEGRASYLDESGLLLGLDGAPPMARSVALPDDALIILVTDGLIERRGENLDDGFLRLSRAALAAGPDLEMLCDQLLAQLGAPTVDDDVALLAVRRL
jgi:serine phosphatase RsbU (regulator of sigma subunit)/DNA-binding response OmpR family regulator